MQFRGNVRFGGESGNRSRKAKSVDDRVLRYTGSQTAYRGEERESGLASKTREEEILDMYVKVLQKMRGEVRPPVHEQLVLTPDEPEVKRTRKLGGQVLRDADDASNSTGGAIDVLDARCNGLEPFVVSFDLQLRVFTLWTRVVPCVLQIVEESQIFLARSCFLRKTASSRRQGGTCRGWV